MASSVTVAKVYELVEDVRKEVVGDLQKLENKIDRGYITKAEFSAMERRLRMVERAVYGVASFIVMSVIGALVALVVSQ